MLSLFDSHTNPRTRMSLHCNEWVHWSKNSVQWTVFMLFNALWFFTQNSPLSQWNTIITRGTSQQWELSNLVQNSVCNAKHSNLCSKFSLLPFVENMKFIFKTTHDESFHHQIIFCAMIICNMIVYTHSSYFGRVVFLFCIICNRARVCMRCVSVNIQSEMRLSAPEVLVPLIDDRA